MFAKMAEFLKVDSPRIITAETDSEIIKMVMDKIDKSAEQHNHELILARLGKLDKSIERLNLDIVALTDLTVHVGTQVETFYNEFSTALDTTTVELSEEDDSDDTSFNAPDKKANSLLN
jgi:hypothetical protein